MIKSRHVVFQLVFTAATVAALLYFIDFNKVLEVGKKLDGLSILFAFALILVSQFLSSVRFHVLLKDSGIRIPRAQAYRANIYSIVGGLFLNVFGQGLTRTALLKKYGVPPSTIFLLTLLERAVALAVLLIGAMIAVALLFQQLHFSIEKDTIVLVRTVVAVLIALGFVYVAALTRRQRTIARWLGRQLFSRGVLSLVAITILMQASMATAYVTLAQSLAPDTRVTLAAAASIVVMLASSLPISFSGWGLRELSASLAFARIGLAPEEGVLIGAAIGVLSLLALVANAGWIGLRQVAVKEVSQEELYVSGSSQVERVSYWLIGLGVGFACLFSIALPTGSGRINVNAGDPLAIVGGLALLGFAWQRRIFIPLWAHRWIPYGLLAFTVVLLISLVHGYLIYGPIDWAIYNRFLGWFVLLSYFGTGTLVVASIGTVGLSSLCRVFAAGMAGIVAFELFARVSPQLAAFFLSDTLQISRAEGFVNNPNAFGFQLLMAIAAAIALPDLRRPRRWEWRTILTSGFLLAGIWISGSRASALALSVALVMLLVVQCRTFGTTAFFMRLGLAVCFAVVMVLAPVFMRETWNLGAAILSSVVNINIATIGSRFALDGDPTAGMLAINPTLSAASVSSDRMLGYYEGFSLWKSHPLFGAGLGAFIHENMLKTGSPLVIHSSFLWVASELGLVGLMAFGVFGVGLAVTAFSKRMPPSARLLLIAVIVMFGVMSLVHDVFYQRLFWLLIGAGAAVPHGLTALARPGGRGAKQHLGEAAG